MDLPSFQCSNLALWLSLLLRPNVELQKSNSRQLLYFICIITIFTKCIDWIDRYINHYEIRLAPMAGDNLTAAKYSLVHSTRSRTPKFSSRSLKMLGTHMRFCISLISTVQRKVMLLRSFKKKPNWENYINRKWSFIGNPWYTMYKRLTPKKNEKMNKIKRRSKHDMMIEPLYGFVLDWKFGYMKYRTDFRSLFSILFPVIYRSSFLY